MNSNYDDPNSNNATNLKSKNRIHTQWIGTKLHVEATNNDLVFRNQLDWSCNETLEFSNKDKSLRKKKNVDFNIKEDGELLTKSENLNQNVALMLMAITSFSHQIEVKKKCFWRERWNLLVKTQQARALKWLKIPKFWKIKSRHETWVNI